MHTFRYDEQGRVLSARMLRHECTFAYDFRGRRIEDKRDDKGVEHRFSGERLASTVVLDRFRTEYHALDDGSCILVDPGGHTHRLRSHGRGIFTRDFANGLSETIQYHPRGGRILAKVLFAKDAPQHAWARRFVYGPEGTLQLVIDSERGPTRHEHDAALRLSKTTHPDGRTDEYRYNAAGTLFQSPTLGQATAGEANRLRYANGEQYEYDHRHHLSRRVSARGTIQYDYDSNDQLAVVFWQGPQGQTWGWDAEYDPLGRRIRKAPGYTNDTHYYWDTDRLAAEVFSDGRVRVYVYPDAFAMVPMLFLDYESADADPSSGRRYYVLTDQRGCVERVLDDTGTIVWKAQVDAYGLARVEVGATFYQSLRFPGHWLDAETGLHYNRFRYYDPMLGRYLQVDPIGLFGGVNLYGYTENPLTQVDIRGLSHEPNPSPSDHDSESPDGCESAAQPAVHHPGEVTATQRREEGHRLPSWVNESNEHLVVFRDGHYQYADGASPSAVGQRYAGVNPTEWASPEGHPQAGAIEHSRAAAHRAIRQGAETNTPHCVAGDGPDHPLTESGWADTPSEGATRAPYEDVRAENERIGHTPRNAGALDHGEPGRWATMHAEKQQGVLRPNEPGGVNLPMCDDCVEHYRAKATENQVPQVQTDPEMTRIFHPDGRVEEVHPDGSVRFDPRYD